VSGAALPASLLAALAAPKTHCVLAVYESGKIYQFDCRNVESARSHAEAWTRKIGRTLIDRESGANVRVVSVSVLTLSQAALAREYVALVGYDIFADDPAITESEVTSLIADIKAAAARP